MASHKSRPAAPTTSPDASHSNRFIRFFAMPLRLFWRPKHKTVFHQHAYAIHAADEYIKQNQLHIKFLEDQKRGNKLGNHDIADLGVRQAQMIDLRENLARKVFELNSEIDAREKILNETSGKGARDEILILEEVRKGIMKYVGPYKIRL